MSICTSGLTTLPCEQLYGISIECIKSIFQNENSEFIITIYGQDLLPVNLDYIYNIEILMIDTRKIIIARYLQNLENPTFESTSDFKKILFDNLPIEILQTTISTSENIIVNKGKIKIELPSLISKYLMIGNLILDVKITDNNGITILNNQLIAIVKKNNFNL